MTKLRPKAIAPILCCVLCSCAAPFTADLASSEFANKSFRNPLLHVDRKGVVVRYFLNNPTHAHASSRVELSELGPFLLSLPHEAWPEGRFVYLAGPLLWKVGADHDRLRANTMRAESVLHDAGVSIYVDNWRIFPKDRRPSLPNQRPERTR